MNTLERIEDQLARQEARLDELSETLSLVTNNLDHLHTDLVAIRHRMRLYNPNCHPPTPDETPAPNPKEE